MKAYIGGTTKDEFFKVFLKKVVTDLETFENLIESDKLEVNLTMTNFKNGQIGLRLKSKNERIDIYNRFIINTLFIQKTFGKGSYLDLKMSQLKMLAIMYLNQYDQGEIIVSEIKRLEEFGWKNSPYLDIFYLLLIENSIHLNKANEALVFARKLEKLRTLSLNPGDERNMVHMSYLMNALSKLGKHEECISLFKKLKEEWLETESEKILSAVARAYSSYAYSLFCTGKKREAMSYQELSLAIMFNLCGDSKDEFVVEEANKLRTILADLGEWKSLRNLEERYFLKPLPKNQPGKVTS